MDLGLQFIADRMKAYLGSKGALDLEQKKQLLQMQLEAQLDPAVWAKIGDRVRMQLKDVTAERFDALANSIKAMAANEQAAFDQEQRELAEQAERERAHFEDKTEVSPELKAFLNG